VHFVSVSTAPWRGGNPLPPYLCACFEEQPSTQFNSDRFTLTAHLLPCHLAAGSARNASLTYLSACGDLPKPGSIICQNRRRLYAKTGVDYRPKPESIICPKTGVDYMGAPMGITDDYVPKPASIICQNRRRLYAKTGVDYVPKPGSIMFPSRGRLYAKTGATGPPFRRW
jgi:hypothetical protein